MTDIRGRFYYKFLLINFYLNFSCPLITSQNTCMLAEFGYDGKLMETFPIDQGKNRKSMYLFKRHALPEMYWQLMLRGVYSGARPWQKILNPTNRQ